MTKYLDVYARVVAYATFVFILIGTKPFYRPEDGIATAFEGSAQRQVTWLALFALTIPIGILHWRRLVQLGRELYLLWIAVGICWASVLWAISPEISFRRVVLFTITLYVLTAITIAHRSIDDWMRMLLLGSGITMLVNWFGVLFLPSLAITELGWAGMHSHKNNAGGLTAVFILWWFFAAINTSRPITAILLYVGTGLWFIFLLGTQSKTSITFCLLCGCIGLMIEYGARHGRQALFLIATQLVVGVVGVATMIVWMTPRRFLEMTFGDPTLTGRTNIWEFMKRQIEAAPLQGHGYGSFWMIGDRSPVIREGWGWFTGTSQGHNGYLDLAATIGIVGTTIFVMSVLLCMWRVGQMVSRRHRDRHGRYAGLLAALLLFALLHNMLESTFMRGSHFVWTTAYMSMIVISLSMAGGFVTSGADRPARRAAIPAFALPFAR